MNLGKRVRTFVTPKPIVAPEFTPPPKPVPAEPERELVPVRRKGDK
jgi:hypothetical protein